MTQHKNKIADKWGNISKDSSNMAVKQIRLDEFTSDDENISQKRRRKSLIVGKRQFEIESERPTAPVTNKKKANYFPSYPNQT